ncbi:MAG: winged helix DNA-binding domain-containing protein [Oscillospiraceae bacterium]|nr:winged helix DNA-binding domain-containing protein [Oscillospiraceae bacterium]
MMVITKQQAATYMLLKHGLVDSYAFVGKAGVLQYIQRVGSIQYDPVDVCGRNADILLQARVKSYTKEQLNELIYSDRELVDYFDKNLCILPMEYLPAMLNAKTKGGYAESYDKRGGQAVKQLEPLIRKLITEKGQISASEIDIDERIIWHWGVSTSLQRAALESMYYRGELIIHHKNGTNKSYALLKDYVPEYILQQELPFTTDEERYAWFVRRRIQSVGLLWNKGSDAWLAIELKTSDRQQAFRNLLENELIVEVRVESIDTPLYISSVDLPFMKRVLTESHFIPRTELLAPLDNMLWDRKLIKAIFDFDYTWEIYTPKVKRKYGAYVLPLIHGTRFIGRVEAINDRKAKILRIANIWYQDGVETDSDDLQQQIDDCFNRFAAFNDCQRVVLDNTGSSDR